MGYADPGQLGTGLRQRLYSRAFIVGDVDTLEDRFAYLVLDTQSGDTAIRHGILTALSEMGGEYAMYGQQNVAVTGTHSHSGPGAWLNYLLPQITSRGFNKASYQAIVDGAVASIVRAHEGLAPGRLNMGSVEVLDANINRSPYAYLANPEHERERYRHDVDKELTALRFSHSKHGGEVEIGVLTWFPVHGTSLHGNNTLISGDNKGVAARLLEMSKDNPAYVAGFSQANVGDTSPNVLGAYCEFGDDEGLLCDFKTSLCGNKTQPCHGRGPYFNRNDAGAASAYEIGRRQFKAAQSLLRDPAAFSAVRGKVVKSFHQFVDLSVYTFPLQNGTVVRTCPAAMGYSFAAGTSDGPGAFDFKQAQPGDPNASPLWLAIGNRIHKANATQKACHDDKVILLDVGESETPYAWSPNIVDVMTLRVGNVFMIVAPGEATTMAGRRWREAVKETASAAFEDLHASSDEPIVVLGGPANTYTHYITTSEEYQVQRYEGASTLYGPYTLDAHINLTLTHLPRLAASAATLPPLVPGPHPPIHVNSSLNFITPVVVDNPGIFKHFGDVTADVKPVYRPGDTISASFIGATPRNNFRLGGTFAAVDKFDFVRKAWTQVRDDADWSLLYEWKRTSTVLGTSKVTISWETRWETEAWKQDPRVQESDEGHGELLLERDGLVADLKGLYRLRYLGDAKSLGGSITAFEGTSGEFRIA
nr:neutral ceramidase b [Quercus suber]